jgi:ADP-heptose:LPS heptosyltransferase
MQNIDTIVDISRKLLINPFKLYNFIQNARHKKYDLCINISSSSLSSQIVTLFVNAKYKLSFEDAKSWVPITHKVIHKGIFQHACLQPLEILAGFGIYEYKHTKELDIKLQRQEREKAKNDLKELLHKNSVEENIFTIAIFRNARFDKKLDDIWWHNFLTALGMLHKNIVIIDILSPDVPAKLNSSVLEYANKDLRQLGAFFSVCDLYISADTGPLHLATASGAASIGLFNRTFIAAYGTLGEQNLNIDLNGINEKDVASKVAFHLQQGQKG